MVTLEWQPSIYWCAIAVVLSRRSTVFDSVISESWMLIGQCGVSLPSFIAIPLPAKKDDVTLVTMVHSSTRRNMPEREGEGRSCSCVSEAMKLNIHGGMVEEQSLFIVFRLFLLPRSEWLSFSLNWLSTRFYDLIHLKKRRINIYKNSV